MDGHGSTAFVDDAQLTKFDARLALADAAAKVTIVVGCPTGTSVR